MRIGVELDTARPRQNGTCRVRITIYKGNLARFPLELHVLPKHWDRAKRRLRFGAPNFGPSNAVIDASVLRAERMAMEQPGASPKAIAWALQQPEVRGNTFEEIAMMDLETTPPKSHHTRKQRRSSIQRFAQWTGPIGAGSITSVMIEEYMVHLEKTCSHNTAAGNLRRLRTIYRRVCRRMRVPPLDILEGSDAVERYTKAPSQFDPEEIARLMAYADAQKGWAAKAPHMWLFSLYGCGIRWGDLCRFRVQYLVDGRVATGQNKNDRAKNVPLHPYAERIAELYREGDYLFAIAGCEEPTEARIASANTIANKYLRKAAAACGITKRIHTHNARHSFAGIAFDANIDDKAIQAAMGIGDKAYKHYKGQIRPETVDKEVERVWEVIGSGA